MLIFLQNEFWILNTNWFIYQYSLSGRNIQFKNLDLC